MAAVISGCAAASDEHTVVIGGCAAVGDRWQQWLADERDEEWWRKGKVPDHMVMDEELDNFVSL